MPWPYTRLVRSVATIGRWSMRRPWRAIGAWLLFVVLAVAAGAATGTQSLENGAVGESARGYALMDHHQAWTPAREYGYLRSDSLTASSPAFKAAVADVSSRMRAGLGSEPTVQVADGGHAVLLTGVVERFRPGFRESVLAVGAAHPGVTIEETGDISASDAQDRIEHRDLHRAELLSIPVTLLVLLFAFGAVVAALVPVLLALTAVAAAFGLIGPISQVFAMDDAVKTVVVLIGMAVGVDYALFYVIRSREERHRGLSSPEAVEGTARTSGRTVVIAGTTVAIAMAGQYIVGSPIFDGIASGTITVVACAVAGSVTVLPAVLELLGPRIDRGRIPLLPHLHTDSTKSRFWPAVIDRVLRRPVLFLAAGAGLLLVLAVPALGMHVAEPDSDTLKGRPDPIVTRMQADFPGTSEPAILVITAPPGQRARVAQALRQLEAAAAARGIAHRPFTTHESADGRATAVELPLTGLGNNTASRQAVATLRNELIPETLGGIPGVETAVTGLTAEDVDFTNQVERGMPYVIAFVLGLAFLLLLVTFRSLVVPLKAIALNLLSVAASYGVLVLVFQHHWAESLLGFHSNGTIIAWLPLFLFVVLFGLSMDYHVFILSRVREGVDSGMSNDDAVRHGITHTAGVVTSAALVMVGVFSIFGTLSALDVKQAGVGLAAAVLIDATIVRAILLPASMKLLGDWNWYLPRRLEWLPRTSEAASTPHELPVGMPAAATEQ